ncbi:MAG: chalcone isomerase family protein, partial [Bdellovibrionales bacterium]|nr:chalcone isomerase family protein [Bdellovibrionales bacterium]
NGREELTIDDTSFGNRYLGIWLSAYPLDETLRDKLLGVR